MRTQVETLSIDKEFEDLKNRLGTMPTVSQVQLEIAGEIVDNTVHAGQYTESTSGTITKFASDAYGQTHEEFLRRIALERSVYGDIGLDEKA